MPKVVVIGMGTSPRDLTEVQLAQIRSAQLLVGGRRHLAAFDNLDVEKTTITSQVDATIDAIRDAAESRQVVVLASGDPLFFGIGARIVAALGQGQVTILPNVSSIAAAFARLGEPWGDAAVVSLHGRDRRYRLLDALKSPGPVAALTDADQSPDWLARWLLDKNVAGWRMAVAEQLGTADERVGWYEMEAAAARMFAQPNVVVLKRAAPWESRQGPHLGMAEADFDHEQGLITKSEVRAVSLSRLRLFPGLTLWDLGAGSGSVGIEAAALLGAGRIVAVEQNADRVDRIRRNAARHRVYNLDAVRAVLPEGLAQLPRPDRIFIGGGGRGLSEIVARAADYLPADGIIVANTVLMDNLTAAVLAMEANGLAVDVVQLQAARSKTMPWSLRFEAQNPVWIVTGSRPAEGHHAIMASEKKAKPT